MSLVETPVRETLPPPADAQFALIEEAWERARKRRTDVQQDQQRFLESGGVAYHHQPQEEVTFDRNTQ